MSVADYLIEDYLIDAQVAEDDAYRRIESGEWTTKDGSVMKVEKMSTDHIKNCIALMKRRKDDYAECWVARFEKELDRRLRLRW